MPLTIDEASNWTTDDVGKWLKSVGLGGYSEMFINNDVDGAILLTMNEDDVRAEPMKMTKFRDIRTFGTELDRLKTKRRLSLPDDDSGVCTEISEDSSHRNNVEKIVPTKKDFDDDDAKKDSTTNEVFSSSECNVTKEKQTEKQEVDKEPDSPKKSSNEDDEQEYYRELKEKAIKLANGGYSNDLEALLDGAPGFVDYEDDAIAYLPKTNKKVVEEVKCSSQRSSKSTTVKKKLSQNIITNEKRNPFLRPSTQQMLGFGFSSTAAVAVADDEESSNWKVTNWMKNNDEQVAIASRSTSLVEEQPKKRYEQMENFVLRRLKSNDDEQVNIRPPKNLNEQAKNSSKIAELLRRQTLLNSVPSANNFNAARSTSTKNERFCLKLQKSTADRCYYSRTESMYVTYVESPLLFYLMNEENFRRLSDDARRLERCYSSTSIVYDEEQEETMKKIVREKLLKQPGSACIVCSTSTSDTTTTSQFYRAEIIRVNNDDVDVRYVDYGNCSTVNVARVRPLLKQFGYAPLCVDCSLKGFFAPAVVSSRTTVAYKTIVARFEKFVEPMQRRWRVEFKELPEQLGMPLPVVFFDDVTQSSVQEDIFKYIGCR